MDESFRRGSNCSRSAQYFAFIRDCSRSNALYCIF